MKRQPSKLVQTEAEGNFYLRKNLGSRDEKNLKGTLMRDILYHPLFNKILKRYS